MIEQNYNLDTIPFSSAIPVVHVSQYDSGSRTLKFKLLAGGSNYDMTGVTGAQINGKKPDGTEFSYNMTISNDVVSIVITEQMAAVAGRVMAEVVLTGANSSVIGTANFIIEVEESPIDEGVISDTDVPIIMDFVTGGTPGQIFKRTATGGEWVDDTSGGGTASDVTYDNTDSGLTATNVQNAIDETVDALNTGLSSAVKSVNTETPDANGNVQIDATNIDTSSGEETVQNNLDKLNGVVFGGVSSDWSVIQKQVEAGLAAELYPVGTQFTVHHSVYGDMLFDVIGHDHDLPTGQEHSMTLLMHNVIYSTQFDEVEGFYYCENGLTAGTYNVTITRQPWFAGDVGKTFQFTLASDVPAGAILCWDGYNATREGRTVRVYNTRGATSAAQTATMTEGNGGTSLGNIDGTGNCNFFDRTVLGSNDWEESGVRQWLNADSASDWWEPKTKWDRLVNYYSRPGFLYGLDADFKNVLVETTHGNRSNTVFDSHGTKVAYNSTEKIFSLCNEEVNLAQEQGIVCGTVYDFYRNAANADRIKYDITSTGTARLWWLRSPFPSHASLERGVVTSGALGNDGANYGFGVAAACVIAGNGNTSGSIIEKVEANETAINSLAGSLAMVETSPATANHAVGDLIVYNNQLYKVTVAIASGEAIVVGANVQADSVADKISPVSVTPRITTPYQGIITIEDNQSYKIGRIVVVNLRVQVSEEILANNIIIYGFPHASSNMSDGYSVIGINTNRVDSKATMDKAGNIITVTRFSSQMYLLSGIYVSEE